MGMAVFRDCAAGVESVSGHCDGARGAVTGAVGCAGSGFDWGAVGDYAGAGGGSGDFVGAGNFV